MHSAIQKEKTSFFQQLHKNIEVGVKSSFKCNMRFKGIYLVWKFYIVIIPPFIPFIQHPILYIKYVQFIHWVQGVLLLLWCLNIPSPGMRLDILHSLCIKHSRILASNLWRCVPAEGCNTGFHNKYISMYNIQYT